MIHPEAASTTPRCRRRAGWHGVMVAAVTLVLAGCDSVTLEDHRGQTLDWSDLRGQWVAVNYWAEWCAPCLKEIPELNRLDADTDVTVLGVNFDGLQGDALGDLVGRMGIRFRTLTQDPANTLKWQTPLALPATFMINPEGQLVETRFGEQTRASLRELIERPTQQP